MSWPLVALNKVVTFFGGGTPSKKNPSYWGGNIPWATVKDIRGASLDRTIDAITQEGLENSASRLVPAGTVILPTRMALGKAAVNTLPVAINQDLKAAIPNASLDVRFLLHFFQSASDAIQKLGAGATVQGITLERLGALKIPLPPLNEQKRIVAVLDKADALRHQRQESLQLTEKLLRSVFFDKFVTSPAAANWRPRSVEWMAKGARGSLRTGPFGSQLLHSEFVDQGIAVLGIDNAVKNRFEWGEPRFIDADKYQNLKRYKVFPGDLIITIMGTVGRCAIIPHNIPEAINTKHLCCISLDRDKCLPEFLHAAFLYHPDVVRQFEARSKGAIMPSLSIGIIKDLQLPLPPIELQAKFEQFVNETDTRRIDLDASREITDRLFGSLQQRAFKGELDLSRFALDSIDETPATRELEKLASKVVKQKKTACFLQVPPAIESALVGLDRTVGKDRLIPWSADYFKYRILGAQPPPFTFADLMQKTEAVFAEPAPYDEIKEIIFDLLGQVEGPALLRQRFELQIDSSTNEITGRKEIVFEPTS